MAIDLALELQFAERELELIKVRSLIIKNLPIKNLDKLDVEQEIKFLKTEIDKIKTK